MLGLYFVWHVCPAIQACLCFGVFYSCCESLLSGKAQWESALARVWVKYQSIREKMCVWGTLNNFARACFVCVRKFKSSHAGVLYLTVSAESRRVGVLLDSHCSPGLKGPAGELLPKHGEAKIKSYNHVCSNCSQAIIVDISYRAGRSSRSAVVCCRCIIYNSEAPIQTSQH